MILFIQEIYKFDIFIDYSETFPNSQNINGKLDILSKNSFDGLKIQLV